MLDLNKKTSIIFNVWYLKWAHFRIQNKTYYNSKY